MWAIYALLSAFFAATSDPIAKKTEELLKCENFFE